MGRTKAEKILLEKKINFAQVGQKPSPVPKLLLGALIIVAAVAAFAKFAVVDRIARVASEQARTAELRGELESMQSQIAELEKLPEQYYHYTLSGMTKGELERVARADVSGLLFKITDQVIAMDSFRLTGNNLSISVTAGALGDITRLVGELQQDPLVETISLTTAQSDEQEAVVRINEEGGEEVVQEEVSNVKAQLNLFLTIPAEEEDAS